MLTMELKAYFMRLQKWEENKLKEVCWEATAQARKKNNAAMTTFTITLTTSWLPAGSSELRLGTRCTVACKLKYSTNASVVAVGLVSCEFLFIGDSSSFAEDFLLSFWL